MIIIFQILMMMEQKQKMKKPLRIMLSADDFATRCIERNIYLHDIEIMASKQVTHKYRRQPRMK